MDTINKTDLELGWLVYQKWIIRADRAEYEAALAKPRTEVTLGENCAYIAVDTARAVYLASPVNDKDGVKIVLRDLATMRAEAARICTEVIRLRQTVRENAEYTQRVECSAASTEKERYFLETEIKKLISYTQEDSNAGIRAIAKNLESILAEARANWK